MNVYFQASKRKQKHHKSHPVYFLKSNNTVALHEKQTTKVVMKIVTSTLALIGEASWKNIQNWSCKPNQPIYYKHPWKRLYFYGAFVYLKLESSSPYSL